MTVDRRRKNGLVGHGRRRAALRTPGEAFGADGAAALYRRETAARPRSARRGVRRGHGAVGDRRRPRLARPRCSAGAARTSRAAIARHVRTYSPSTRAQVAEDHRRLQFRNRYLMWLKNETRGGPAAPTSPRIAAYEVAALGHVAAARAAPAARLRGGGAGPAERARREGRAAGDAAAVRAHAGRVTRLLTVSRARIPRASWSAIVQTTGSARSRAAGRGTSGARRRAPPARRRSREATGRAHGREVVHVLAEVGDVEPDYAGADAFAVQRERELALADADRGLRRSGRHRRSSGSASRPRRRPAPHRTSLTRPNGTGVGDHRARVGAQPLLDQRRVDRRGSRP